MMRIDVYLVEKGFAQSRGRAKDMILEGLVSANGKVVEKPSFLVDDNADISVNTSLVMPFVGRGGLKLEKAITDFDLDFTGKYVLDVGASTGGFAHCALQHGAEFVWAVDVGTNQLDSSLRNHPQVCSLEDCDIRMLEQSAISRKVDFIVADLSFISLTKVASYLPKFLAPNGAMMLLVKPQFEAGREFVGKNGIVKNSKVHQAVIQNVADCFTQLGMFLHGISYAPILQKTKNIEYLSVFQFDRKPSPDYRKVIAAAFAARQTLR